jgi:hypothetical protein
MVSRFTIASLLNDEKKKELFNPVHLRMDLFRRHQRSNANSIRFDSSFIDHPMPLPDSPSSSHSLSVSSNLSLSLSSSTYLSLPSLPATRSFVTLPMIPDLPRSGLTLEDLFRFVGVEDDVKNWQPNIPVPPHVHARFRFCCSSLKPSNPKNIGFPCSQRTRKFQFYSFQYVCQTLHVQRCCLYRTIRANCCQQWVMLPSL